MAGEANTTLRTPCSRGVCGSCSDLTMQGCNLKAICANGRGGYTKTSIDTSKITRFQAPQSGDYGFDDEVLSNPTGGFIDENLIRLWLELDWRLVRVVVIMLVFWYT